MDILDALPLTLHGKCIYGTVFFSIDNTIWQPGCQCVLSSAQHLLRYLFYLVLP